MVAEVSPQFAVLEHIYRITLRLLPLRRLAEVPRDLWDKYELAFNENILLDSESLADFGYPYVQEALGRDELLNGVSASVPESPLSLYTSSSGFPWEHPMLWLRVLSLGTDQSCPHQPKLDWKSFDAHRKVAWLGSVEDGVWYTRWYGPSLIVRMSRDLCCLQARTLCWLFVLLSIANAIWLFTRRRQYRLFLRSVGVYPSSIQLG